MRLFALLILLSVISSFDVGYFKRNSGDERYMKVMELYAKNVTTNSSIEINIVPCDYSTPGREKVDNCLKELVDKKITLIYAYCDKHILSTDDKYLNDNDVLIWCVNTFNVGMCKKHHIMGTSLTNSINIISFIISNIGGSAAFLGGSDSDGIDEFYLQDFAPALKGMGLALLFNTTTTTAQDITDYIDVLKKYYNDHPDEAIVTLSSIKNPTLIQQLVNGIKTAGIDADHHTLFYLQSGILSTEVDTIATGDATFKANNEGNVAFRAYDTVIDNDESRFYQEKIYDSSNTKSVSIETYHTGLIKLLFYALNLTVDVNNLTNTSPYTLLSILNDEVINYAGGNILLVPNHYIVTTYYGFEYVTGGGIETAFEIPYSLRFEPNSTFGEIQTETCNFKMNEDTGISAFDTINVILIQNLTSYHCFNENVNRRMINALVDEVNFQGGVLGKQLQFTFYELSNDKDVYLQAEEIVEICNTSNIHTILLLSTVETRDVIYNTFEEAFDNEGDDDDDVFDYMIFYYGPNEGELCKEKMIFAGVSQYNYVQTVMDYILTQSYDYIMILGSGYKYGLGMQKTIKEQLYTNGYNSSQVAVWNLLNEDDTLDNVKQILTTRILGLNKTNLPVIVTAEKEFHFTLFEAMKDLKIDEEHGYTVFVITLDIIQAQSIGYSFINNTIYTTQYYTENKEFVSDDLFFYVHKKMIKEVGTYIPISSEMVLLFTVYQQWRRSVVTAGNENPKLYRQFLYHQKTDDLISGTYEIYYNGYGQAPLFLLKLHAIDDSNATIEVVSKDPISRRPYTYVNQKNKTCDWRYPDKPIFESSVYRVVTLFYSKSKVGVEEYNSLLLILDLINQDGGINGKELLLEFTNYDGDYKNIVSEAEGALNKFGDSILCFIGGTSKEEYDAVDDFLKEHELLLFSVDPVPGNFAYRNIIFMNYVSTQFVEFQIYWLLSNYDNFMFIVTPNITPLLKAELEFVQSLYQYYKITPIKETIYYNVSTIKSVLNETVYSLNDTAEKEPVMIVTALDSDTIDFLQVYNDLNIDQTRFPVVISDYSQDMYSEDNQHLWKGHFASKLYDQKTTYKENTLLKDTINTYKGSAETNINQRFILMYDIFQFFAYAIPNAENETTIAVKQKMYNAQLDLPDGPKSLYATNYATSHSLVFHFGDTKDDDEIVMDLFYPLGQFPYHFLTNQKQYYVSDFSYGQDIEKTGAKYYGIAFLFELKDRNQQGYSDYLFVKSNIEYANYYGGIKGKRIYSELYQCPETVAEGADLVFDLYERGFNIIIGGCDVRRRDLIVDRLLPLEMIMFYLGPDTGNHCKENVFYMNMHFTQGIQPALLHFLYTQNEDFGFIYSLKSKFESVITFINTMLDAWNVKPSYSKGVNNENRNEEQILENFKMEMSRLHENLTNGGNILAIFEDRDSELFFESLYDYVKNLYGVDAEIQDYFTVYMIDFSHTTFRERPETAEGHYIYTPFAFDDSNMNIVNYENNWDKVTNKKQSRYVDVLAGVTTQFILQIFQDSKSDDYEVMRQQIYTTTLDTAIGTLRFDAENRCYQSFYIAKVNKKGEVYVEKTISTEFPAETYHVNFNRLFFAVCDWRDAKKEVIKRDMIRFGLILPNSKANRESGIEFYQGLYTAVNNFNLNGGIDGKYILLNIVGDNNDPDYAALQMEKMYNETNIFIFFGGWTSEIRKSLHEVAVKYNCLLFFPSNYEGEECYYNGFYAGMPYSSYYAIVPQIMSNSNGYIILLYGTAVRSVYFAEHLKEDLEYFNIELNMFTQIPPDITDLKYAVENIKKICPKGAIIISLLDGSTRMNLLSELYNADARPPLFVVYNINLDDTMVSESTSIINDQYIYDSFVHDDSNEDLTKYDKLFKNLFTFIKTANYLIARGIALGEILFKTFELTLTRDNGNFTYDNLRKNIYDVETNTVLGTLVFGENNNLKNILSLERAEIDENGEFDSVAVYQTKIPITNRPFGNIIRTETIKRCNLRYSDTKEEINYKRIALLFSTTGTMKTTHARAIYSALTALRELYDEDLINGEVLLLKLVNFDSDEAKLEEEMKKLRDDNSIVAYVGCTGAECRSTAQSEAELTGRLFFYPRSSTGEQCSYYTFTTSIVPNQYVTRLMEYLITTDYNSFIYIIGQNRPTIINLMDIIDDAAKGLFTPQGRYLVDENNPISSSLVNSIIQEKISEGGIILTVFTTVNYLVQFLQYVYRAHIDYNKIAIVDCITEVEDTDIIPSNYKDNLYKFSRYMYDVDTEDNKNFKDKLFLYTGETYTTSLAESTYASIKLYAKAARDAKTFNSTIVKSKVYGNSITSGSGKVTVDASGYVTSPFFVSKYSASTNTWSTVYSKYDTQTPQPWSWNLKSSYGYMCSFADGIIKDKYQVPVQRTVLIASLTGDLSINTKGLVDVYQMTINKINDNNGGVGGYTLKADVYDIQSNTEYCKANVGNYIKENQPLVVFAQLTAECYNYVKDSFDTILFFELNEKEQNFCKENVMVSVQHPTFLDNIIEVIRSRFYRAVMIIVDVENNQYNINAEYMMNYMKKYYIPFGNYTYSSTRDGRNTRELLNVFNTIYYGLYINSTINNEASNDQGLIIHFGPADSFKFLVETLQSSSELSNSKHKLLVMEHQHLIRTFDLNGLKEYEALEFYDSDSSDELNVNFKNEIYQRIQQGTFVSDLMIRTYSSINLWSEAIQSLPKNMIVNDNKVADVSLKNVRDAIIKIQFNSPEGLVYFAKNQYLSRIPKLFKYTHNETSKSYIRTLSYFALNAIEPEAYSMPSSSQYRLCDFTDDNILNDGTVSAYQIAVILSLTGKNKKKEIPIFEAVRTAIKLINKETGYLINRYISMDLFDAKSSDDNYLSITSDIIQDKLNNNQYAYVFAGYFPETFDQLAPLFTETTKLLFFLGKPLGMKCYSDAIAIHPHPSMIVQSTIRRLLELSSSAYLIHSDDTYCNRIADLMTLTMQRLIITANGNIIYNKNSNRLLNDIERALPNGGYIIFVSDIEDDIYDFYKKICSSKVIKPPSYTIINVLLDENMVVNIISQNSVSCLNGHIIMGSYFESLSSSNTNLLDTIPSNSEMFNMNYHINCGSLFPSTDIESAFATVELWKYFIKKNNVFGKAEGSADIYHYFITLPSGESDISVSNFCSRKIYSGTFNENSQIIVNWGPTVTFKPSVYSEYNTSEIGLVCDFSDKNKGARYDENPIIISFIHEKDLGGRTERYNALIQNMIINNMNDLGGILGRKLAANHTWVTISDAYRNIRDIVEVGRSKFLFGCITSECRTEVNRYLSNHMDYLYFFTGRDDGIQCSNNVITTGLGMTAKIVTFVEYIKTMQLEYLYIIGPDRNSSYTEIYIIEKALKLTSMKLLDYKLFSAFNTIDVATAIKAIEDELNDVDRIAVVNLFVAYENNQLTPTFVASTKWTSMIMFYMKYDPLDIDSKYRVSISGSYVITSYSSVISNTASGAFQYLTKSEYQNAIELNEIIESSYSSVNILKLAMEYSADYDRENALPGSDYVKLSLKYVNYDSPSGIFSIKDNNHANKNIYILRLSSDNEIQVFPSQGMEYSMDNNMTYIDDKENCEFAKKMEVYDVDKTMEYIVIGFTLLNVILCLLFGLIVYVYRHSRIIKSASPLFLFYTLLSLVILSCCGNIFTQLPTEEYICELRIWCLSLSIDFVFSIMFCKAWRIHRLFNNKELQRVKVSNTMLLKMIGMILIVQIIYLLLWTFIEPSEPSLRFSSGFSTYLSDIYLQECSSSIPFVVIQLFVIVIIFIWGGKLAWGVRKASAEFNESMSLMSTIGLMLIMGIILVPLDYLMADDPDTLVLLRSLGIEIGVFGIILLQFSSKVIYVWKVEMSTTFGSSSLGSSGNSSGSRAKSQALKRAAARGRFTLHPKILNYCAISIATISESDRFFEEKLNLHSSIRVHNSSSISRQNTSKISAQDPVL